MFALLTAGLLYTTLEPVVGPYARVATLFVGDEVYDAHFEETNLLAQAPPRDNEDPVDWTPVEDHRNPEETDDPIEEPVFLKASEITKPQPGDLYAHITISGTTVDAPVYWGDSERELNKGAGTYMGGWLPGFGRTVLIGGHRSIYFGDFKSVEIGAVITIETHYETYTYEVIRIEPLHKNDKSAYDFTRDEENLILYTCYPFDRIAATDQRLFVYAEPLTGIPVARFT